MVCDDSEKALQLMHSKTNLEYIVVIESINQDVQSKAESLNIKYLTFDQLRKIGQNHLKPVIVSDCIQTKVFKQEIL